MQVDLVQITTRDGLRLDGMFQAAHEPLALAVDGFCLVHGTGGNFYSSTLFDSLAERLRGLGAAVLRVNTRGHDGISTAAMAPGGRRLGAAFEVVDDCRHDLAGWVDWLRQRAGPRIGLIGHSLGAVKCLYALASEPQSDVQCVVALSPPRLSYSWFCASPEGPTFLDDFARAEEQLKAGQPGALIEVRLPMTLAIAAGGYVEKYGPEERYNYLRFVASVGCPVLVTFGTKEVAGNMAFRAAPEELRALNASKPHIAVEVVDGADHFYTGLRSELNARLEAWLRVFVPA